MKRAPARERLSRDVLAASALALADREGLEAVTIRRLAQDHAVTPMALYWHFKDKDELLDGIAERLFAGVVLPDITDRPWDTDLHAVLEAFLSAMRPHPATVGLVVTRVLQSDAGLVVAERVLGLLRAAGFSTEQTAEIAGYLLSSVVTLISAEPGPEPALDSAARDAAIRGKKATLHALSPERFPNVVASADALAYCANEDSYFNRGVDLLVQGVRGIRST
jgi:AcrR family transcriptional regulator